jgi:uncharacterized protein YndB with AHSA1/START domain
MKALRYGSIALGIVAFLYVLACGLGEPRIDVATTVVLPYPPERIFPLIADLRERERWNPYDDGDTTVRYTYSDRTQGVGAEYGWTSENGPGKIRIDEVQQDRLVRETLTFADFGTHSDVSYRLEKLSGETRVTWSMQGRAEFPFLVRGLFAIGLNGEIDRLQRRGLEQLGEAVGKTTVPEPVE